MPAVAGMVHHYLGRHRSTPDTPGPNSSKQTPCRAASFLGHSNFKPDQAGRREIGGAFVSCGMLDAEFARAARGERPSPDDTILLPPDMPLLSPVGARREEPPCGAAIPAGFRRLPRHRPVQGLLMELPIALLLRLPVKLGTRTWLARPPVIRRGLFAAVASFHPPLHVQAAGAV